MTGCHMPDPVGDDVDREAEGTLMERLPPPSSERARCVSTVSTMSTAVRRPWGIWQ